MIFVLQYDRSQGQIVEQQEFADSEGALARDARLRADLAALGDPNLEIVTLQAESREALLKTHARYFKTIRELAEDFARQK
jgi:hypothetical protein